MKTLSEAYKDLIGNACGEAKAATYITPENVYQIGNRKLIAYHDRLIKDLALPGSALKGAENIRALFEKAKAGASCLILPEHYSNTDLSCFSHFLRKALPDNPEIEESVVAVASMKLNEDNPAVAVLASAYSRIVLCPSRYLPTVNGKKDEKERLRIMGINRAAMAALTSVKNGRKMILVFPAGTRYKPWAPETKKVGREIDSYIRNFDFMCFVSINGMLLKVREGGYIDDYVNRDIVLLEAGPVLSCREFRETVKMEALGAEDKKQAVADAIAARLEMMHKANEAEYRELLEKAGG